MGANSIDNPVLADVWRGTAIESRHRGAVCVTDARGRVVFECGDIQRPTFPRSAIKFLQAIPLLETGAADHYQLTDQQISFACASHNAEPIHTDLARSWLHSIECTAEDLACGAELPLDLDTAARMQRDGESPERYHHNCSGKHLGFLTTCRHMQDNIADYRDYDHPAQQRWLEIIESLAQVKTQTMPWGYDGCGIPTLALPLQNIAQAFAKFAEPEGVGATRASAMERIASAVAAEPYMVAGRNRLCTALMEVTGRNVLVKTGAEGYYTATIADKGYGVALKIDDGHSRASVVVIGAVLQRLGVLSSDQNEALASYFRPELTNSRKEIIGYIEPSAHWQ